MSLINVACETLRISTLVKLDDTKVIFMVVIHIHTFVIGYHAHDKSKKMLNKIKGNEDKTKLDEESIKSYDLSSFHE